MANYFSNRRNEEFIYTRLNRNFQSTGEYNFITGGSIEYASDSDLSVTAKFNFTGYTLPSQNDLIRVSYKFKDDDGEISEEILATLFASYSSVTYQDTLKGIQASGTLTGNSVLSVMKNKKIGAPKTIKRASNVLSKVRDLCEECGLYTKIIPSGFALTADYTFKEGADYLTIINTLLSLASYKNAYSDNEGYVVLEPLDYSSEDSYHTFINDELSIMYPEIEVNNDWVNTPNVVHVLYNTDTSSMMATARNLTGSQASLDNRFEITYTESISSIESKEALQNKAVEILKDKSLDIEYVKFSHAYAEIMKLYDTVKINYDDLFWEGQLTNFSIELSPSVKTTSKVKRTLLQDVVITSEVEVYR